MNARKGLAVSTLVMLIIFVVIMGVLLNFVARYSKQQQAGSNLEACRLSILAFQEIKATTGDLVSAPKFDCKVSQDVIRQTDKQRAIREVADHMRWCWYKSLGRDNKVGINRWLGVDWVKKDVDWCLVCSEFSLAYGTPEFTIDEVTNFLQTQKISQKDQTYANVIKPCWEWPAGSGQTAWDRVFVSVKRECRTDPLDGSTNYCTGLLSAGGSDPCPIFPGDSTTGDCYKLINKGTWTFKPPSTKSAPAKKYYVMFTNGDPVQNCPVRFSQLIVIPEEELPNIKCDALHYQTA